MDPVYKQNNAAIGRSSALRHLAACAAIAVTAFTAAYAQPTYTLRELPIPAGYDATVPYNINDQGFIVGCASNPNPNSMVATIWRNGTVSVLGKLDKGTYSIANAINSKGVVVGEGDDGDGRPLGWITSGSKLVNFFSNNGGNTHPIAINDNGDIGGYYIKFSSTWRGAIWKIDAKDARKSTKIDLPILVGTDPSKASAIPFAFNKSGQGAGWVMNEVIGQHAAMWNSDAAHSLVDLGTYPGDWSSVANSLNDFGQVVGSSHPPFSSRAVVWDNDPAHTAIELPLLPGDNYGSASFINNQGTAVGSSAYGEPGTWNISPSRIVIWVDGRVYDLESMLDATGTGWTLQTVMGMNNLGQIVGCASYNNGVSRAVVLTPAP
ncbi:hypothetical protein ACXR0O_06105 [Verrucomicrobiota bacterium sgz303538]